jgi:hypothetical protein
MKSKNVHAVLAGFSMKEKWHKSQLNSKVNFLLSKSGGPWFEPRWDLLIISVDIEGFILKLNEGVEYSCFYKLSSYDRF